MCNQMCIFECILFTNLMYCTIFVKRSDKSGTTEYVEHGNVTSTDCTSYQERKMVSVYALMHTLLFIVFS